MILIIAYNEDTLAIGIARLGSYTDQVLKAGSLKQLATQDYGPPLHSLVIVGNRMHVLEADYMRRYVVGREEFDQILEQDYKI